MQEDSEPFVVVALAAQYTCPGISAEIQASAKINTAQPHIDIRVDVRGS